MDNWRETFHLKQNSAIPHEFRTTVYSGFHQKEDLEEIAGQLYAGEQYALQNIQYEKTLNPKLPRTEKLDLEAIATGIRIKYPLLQLEVRS